MLVFQTLQLPHLTTETASSKHASLVLSAGPSVAPAKQASSWDTAPPRTGDGYVSPLIDLYLERDSDLEALYEDSPADRDPVSYEDVLDAPYSSEADPAESESIPTEDKSYRETV